jgi:phage host-nuclease inhibitor protein Gam
MASSVTKLHRKSDDLREELERSFAPQIEDLRKELASLSEAVSKLGHHRLDDFRDGASDAMTAALHESERALRTVGRQARVVGTTVRSNPISTIAISAGVAALIAYLARRENWR